MGLGAGEIIVLLIIAYVVVGPEDTVKLAKKLAEAMKQFRRMTAEVKTGLDDIGIDDVKSDGTGADSFRGDMESVMEEIRKTEQTIRF